MLKIVPISSKKELRKFAQFPIDLYKGNPYAVPQLIGDVVSTLHRDCNPAYDFCDAQCFLCYRDGEIVGRVAAIHNPKANATWNNKNGRFGFIDFIEDYEVAQALISAAEKWLKERGATAIEGPLGFMDFDPEGMLVEGFDQLGTMITIYNHSYYPQFMERMGFLKATDWIEHKIYCNCKLPERIEKVANIMEARCGLRIKKFKNAKEIILSGYGQKLFDLTDQAFAHLYGYSSLSQAQKDAYIKQYMPVVRTELLIMVVDKDDKLIGYGLGIPSMSKALQKARGRLFPFGFIYMLRALKAKRSEVIDLMLIAVDNEWLNKGVNAVIMKYFHRAMEQMGCIYAESNPELETNDRINNQWNDFKTEDHKRRRIYIRDIK